MDEVIRDLVVIGLIALVCFAGAVEYVYWRLGYDKIVSSLEILAKAEQFRTARIIAYARKAGTSEVA
ncbi:MAG TPA: hypothetical protein VM912_04760 [Terriglobales bacterium]|nr:hypothetical protein [Terriglobales bacterium]